MYKARVYVENFTKAYIICGKKSCINYGIPKVKTEGNKIIAYLNLRYEIFILLLFEKPLDKGGVRVKFTLPKQDGDIAVDMDMGFYDGVIYGYDFSGGTMWWRSKISLRRRPIHMCVHVKTPRQTSNQRVPRHMGLTLSS